VLLQGESTFHDTYTTPDRYESQLKERGIFFPETYVETTTIPGHTYQYARTEIDRYATAAIEIKNASCARVKVDLAATFDFGGWDSLKRAGGAGVVSYLGAKLTGQSDDDAQKAAWKAAAGAASGLHGDASVVIAPQQTDVVSIDIDTQSLFGNNRKMNSVNLEHFDVILPDGPDCRPSDFSDLRDLSGKYQPIRDQYKRACEKGRQRPACDYLAAVDKKNARVGLVAACNGGKAPNFEAACERLRFESWLNPSD
jgi:hypothetical protein